MGWNSNWASNSSSSYSDSYCRSRIDYHTTDYCSRRVAQMFYNRIDRHYRRYYRFGTGMDTGYHN